MVKMDVAAFAGFKLRVTTSSMGRLLQATTSEQQVLCSHWAAESTAKQWKIVVKVASECRVGCKPCS